MKSHGIEKKKNERVGRILFLCATGLFAGFANGLLGAGGGILAAFGLLHEYSDELSRRDVYANALCVMLPLSALSFVRYTLAGNPAITEFGGYLLPAVLGGFLGGILLGRLKSSVLKHLFGALVIWSGVMLIIR